MADAPTDERIGIRARSARRGACSARWPGGFSFWSSRVARAARELRRRVGVFGVGFVAARRASFGERALVGIDELAWDLHKETGRRRGLQALAAVDAAVNGARQRKRVAGAGHADVAQAALLLDLIGIVQGAAVREGAFLEAGQVDVVEFEPLGGVQGEQSDRRAI